MKQPINVLSILVRRVFVRMMKASSQDYLNIIVIIKKINGQLYIVKNGNEPTLGNPTEEKQSELEEFIDYSKTLVGTLGHKVFEPLISQAITHIMK